MTSDQLGSLLFIVYPQAFGTVLWAQPLGPSSLQNELPTGRVLLFWWTSDLPWCLHLCQVPVSSPGGPDHFSECAHGSHCCLSEILRGKRERTGFPPPLLVPWCSILRQIDHTAMSGLQLALGKHFIHDVIIDFPCPDSPCPHFPASLLL